MRDAASPSDRACIAAPRRVAVDRRAADAAGIERRQPRDAGLVLADTGVVIDRSERIDPDGGFGLAAEDRAMRAGDDDRPLVVRPHQRIGIDSPDWNRPVAEEESVLLMRGR